MREAVERLFDKRVRHKIMRLNEHSRDELLKQAYEHPKKETCIDNVVYQLRLLKLQRQMTKKNFVDIIYSCADLYVAAVVEHLKQRILTAGEVQRRIDDANKEKNLMAEFEAETIEATSTKIKSFAGAPARSNA